MKEEQRVNSLGSSQRRFLAGICLLVCAGVLVTVVRWRKGISEGSVPEYRQKGPKNAPVTLVDYSDFQCPSCRVAALSLHEILEKYPGKIHISFHHNPLEKLHAKARLAAEAAECAGLHGKFWEFHDLLYERQDVWVKAPDTRSVLISYAVSLSIPEVEFKSCLDSSRPWVLVSADQKQAKLDSVDSTPTIFINGKRYVGSNQLVLSGSEEIKKLLGLSP